ncbi:hypothetical protein [Proteus faecis]|uniref:hypothetical protein n=1 Tax=Proteus faecis TaxID=2050967 RepID=UPI003075CAC7
MIKVALKTLILLSFVKNPECIIEKRTLTTQKVMVGQLRRLAEMAETMESPALIIVGEVVTLNEKLQWFQSKLAN